MFLFWNDGPIYRVQIFAWTLGVLVLAARYGVLGQIIVYSSDQSYYFARVTQVLSEGPPLGIPSSLSWWIVEAQTPFVISGAFISLIGVHPIVALKTVSLISLLLLTKMMHGQLLVRNQLSTWSYSWLTLAGPVGSFFSVWALRDMLLTLCTTAVFLLSGRKRVVAFVFVFMLRPHLAVSMFLAVVLSRLWSRATFITKWKVFDKVATVSAGWLLGPCLLSFGNVLRTRFEYSLESGSFADGGGWLIRFASIDFATGVIGVTRYVSALFGLQFLTAADSSVTYSIRDLLLYRILLAELWLVPTLLFILLLLNTKQLSVIHRVVLLSLSIYVGLAAGTEYSSARQNLPFIPIMGFLIAHSLREMGLKRRRLTGDEPNSVAICPPGTSG